MNYIKSLNDLDFNLTPIPFNNPRLRFGARGIIYNLEGKIAILFKKSKNEYKLIGGGIDENEKPRQAFRREALEETGFRIKIDKELGLFEELKSLDNFKQTSYIYVAHIVGKKNSQSFTLEEIENGAELIWCSLDEAMYLIKNSEEKLLPSKIESNLSLYHTKFIVRRDYEILKYYKNVFEIK